MDNWLIFQYLRMTAMGDGEVKGPRTDGIVR
jgi:hypothetical protein